MSRGESFLQFMIAAAAVCAMTVIIIAIWAYVWDVFA